MRILCLAILVFSPIVTAFDYSHGVSYLEPLKYDADFRHFEYVNPDAPKGGIIRSPEMGTFDSFNNILDKGRVAGGLALMGSGNLLYDRLLETSIDEPASYYGRLAEGVWVADDFKQMAFKIRPNAYWHDGAPLTAADVVFTFETFKDSGSAGIKTALLELESIERISDNEVLFTTKAESSGNPTLLFAIGAFPILPKHYWETRDITKTTTKPPLGSGPYRVGKFEIGRNITMDRVDDYWGADIPVNRGRYNFDQVKWDYFRDEAIQVEAIKGDVIDIRNETVSKNWNTAYNFPALKEGYFKRELVDLDKPWGLWWPVMWNLDRERFQDIRVREALWLLSDFNWTNRVLMYGYYNYANSFFYNSPMASSGLPSDAELALLGPFRGKIPERVFTHPWVGNVTAGFGYDRDSIKRSLQLFKEAGWQIHDGVMTNVKSGEPFEIDFIFISPMGLRQETPFMRTLNRVGIHTTARAPEISNWLYRMRSGKFDGAVLAFEPGNTPGLQLLNRFGTASANTESGQNWSNIRDPAVDAMIDLILAARKPQDFYAATRALDRILLWNFYYIPGLGAPGFRLVYWDKFGIPENRPPLRRIAWIDTWWWDETKAERVRTKSAVQNERE